METTYQSQILFVDRVYILFGYILCIVQGFSNAPKDCIRHLPVSRELKWNKLYFLFACKLTNVLFLLPLVTPKFSPSI
jgi:hypothetical protein